MNNKSKEFPILNFFKIEKLTKLDKSLKGTRINNYNNSNNMYLTLQDNYKFISRCIPAENIN
jgi:hypothetical protein